MAPDRVTAIPGPAGSLEALLEPPAEGRALKAAVVFGHPHPLHGGTMHTRMVYRSTKALAGIGCAVLRVNFRGVGRSEGAWDNGVGEIDDLRAGFDFMAARYPDAELWSAGMSFGAYVSLMAGVADDRVGRLIAIAPALHLYDFAPVRSSRKPKYFVQGAEDELCPLENLVAFYHDLPEPKHLEIVDGANHLFDGRVDEATAALARMLDH